MHPMTAALAYAREGYRVFPCKPNKAPLDGSRGFLDATTDPDQIRTWWTDNPDYLIGIANGNGLLVMDVDSYKPGGTPEWDAFVTANGGLPETYTTRTGRGGMHYWFRYDPAREVRRSLGFFANVDACADGGYIIAPPSVSETGVYTVVEDLAVEDAPEWLLVEIVNRKKAVVASTPFTVVKRDEMDPDEIARCDQYAQTAIDLELGRLDECSTKAVASFGREVYTGPEWNKTTYEVACNLLEIANSTWNAVTEADALDALLARAPRDRNFTDADVMERWTSARKTVADTGRPMPAKMGGGLFIPFSAGVPKPTTTPDSFFVKDKGLDTALLASQILLLGPLAVDDTENRGFWRYTQGVWVPAPHEVSDRATILLGPRFRPGHVSTTIPFIQAELTRRGEIIDCGPVEGYVNLRNGMLDWRTGVLHGHDPSFHSTVQLPVSWNPDAICPRFDCFVTEVMAPDAHAYLWEMMGYLLLSGNPLQRAFLFKGAGINGKGTLIRVIRALLGDSNVSSVTLTDLTENKFEAASLYGKIANVAGDIDATYMKNTAKFKAITGEDMISAERKYEHSFKFQCWAVPVFSANEFWKSSDTTTGYRRRWQVLPFPNQFTIEGGHGLTERLSAEVEGILVHALASLRTLMARGDFDTPKSALEEKARFELAADQVAEWLDEDPSIVVKDPANPVSIPVADAYRAYKRWAEDNGNSALPSSKWWQRMEQAGYSRRKSGVMKVQGLQIDQRINATDWSRTPSGL